MKLSIGTAQFGFNYGICNKTGVVKKKEVLKILKFSRNNKIKNLDTAQGYGISQKILGLCGVKDFDITTKLSSINNLSKNKLNNNLKFSINSIFKDLKIKKLHSLLIHNSSILNGKLGKILYEELKSFKKNQKISKIGVSVYTVKELEKLINKYELDIINIPFSVANNSFADKKILKKLKSKKIEVHVRSVFLQGLLLNDIQDLPKKLSKLTFFSQWHKWLENNKYNALEASLAFVKNVKEIDKIIVGVDNLDQLKGIVKAYKCKKKFKFVYFKKNKLLRNPSLW